MASDATTTPSEVNSVFTAWASRWLPSVASSACSVPKLGEGIWGRVTDGSVMLGSDIALTESSGWLNDGAEDEGGLRDGNENDGKLSDGSETFGRETPCPETFDRETGPKPPPGAFEDLEVWNSDMRCCSTARAPCTAEMLLVTSASAVPSAAAELAGACPVMACGLKVTISSRVLGIETLGVVMVSEKLWVSAPTGSNRKGVHPTVMPFLLVDSVEPGAVKLVAFLGTVTDRLASMGRGVTTG